MAAKAKAPQMHRKYTAVALHGRIVTMSVCQLGRLGRERALGSRWCSTV